MKSIAKKKVEILKNKPRQFKIGQVVKVDFIGVVHLATIQELYQPKDYPTRWAYKVRLEDGTIIPYVGIENTEKFCNIVVSKE